MTKFLNISTDTTLGGDSPSDETVSSQKAVKSYVDSQTGTAPAFANITGQPTDNANLAAALDKKENIPYISLYNGSSGNPRPIKFLTVDYTNTNSENGVFIKITMQSSHGNGVSYAFLQDAFFNINYTGTISCEVFKYFGATTSYDGSRQYGDIFWVHDSENKIVDFYTLMGQFSALYSTPYRRLNASTGGEITQLTTASTYSEGTQVWASCGDYYTTADPVLTNLTTNATSLTIKGNPISPACGNSINIGYSSSVGDNGEVCVGVGASTRQIASTAIGFYASATKTNAIQIGTGTNSTANTFNVGFRNVNNYLLLDGTTGLIPDARLSSNIARTSAIPTVNNATLTITQGGTTKGTFTANASSNVTIDLDSGGSVDVDNKSITTNSSDEIQTVGVINSRDSSTAVKVWTGTKAQYDAIVSKDANTLYNITDDTDVSLTILEALYPVGSIYITTANTCPLSTLISGSTWELVSSGIVKSGEVPVRGNGMSLGLTDGTTNAAISLTSNPYLTDNNSYGQNVGSSASGHPLSVGKSLGITLDPTKSGIIADTSSLTLSVNIYERTV